MRALATLVGSLAALAASVAASTVAAAPVAVGCDPRPVVEQFVGALNAGDAAAADALFAQPGSSWHWYAVGDRAGRRLGDDATLRDTLQGYFESRARQHETLRLLRLDDNGNGNFGFLVERRADDLQGGAPVRRLGKGWVACESGTIGVWVVGGAPAPAAWGRCPRAARVVREADLPAARAAVLRFVRDVWSEMVPALDGEGARVTGATLATGVPKGYTARVRCGRDVQARTAVVTVRFPRVAEGDPMASPAFYASRTGRSWRVWRLAS